MNTFLTNSNIINSNIINVKCQYFTAFDRILKHSLVILYAISLIGHKMNQTKKRLSIIKLAISITDIDTIHLQTLKLTPIKTDVKINEILTLLQAGNYAQAQGLITTYIETAPDEVLQRTSQEESSQTTKDTISDDDQAIIDEFNLFVTPPNNHSQKPLEIDINNYAGIEPKITKDKRSIDFDSLLNIDAKDVLPDNIDINLSNPRQTDATQDTFFESAKDDTSEIFLEDNTIPTDTFFEDTPVESIVDSKIKDAPFLEENGLHYDEEKEEKEVFSTPMHTDKESTLLYEAMPHISQKLISMKKQYPLIQQTNEKFETVESLLSKIATEGYTETEIEEMINYIKKLLEKEKYTEAAQLLLVCGATESKFAQLMLARELFTGSMLTKNIPEAFTLINTLAIEDYPEALCDLGQFYENGIGTTTDPMKAEGLYKEAVNLGIKRAKKHYARLKKHNRGFFKS